MSDRSPSNRDRADDAFAPSGSPDESLGALLRATGRRPMVPAARAERVRSAVHAHWQAESRRRAARRWIWTCAALAAAATVAITVGLGLHLPGPTMSDEAVAHVEVLDRAAWIRTSASDAPVLLRSGDPIPVGSELATESGGRLAVRLASGHSVRLDSLTRLRVLSARRFALDLGALYVASSSVEADPHSIELQTPFGELTDRGTQFEARLADASLFVRVREGAVSLGRGAVPIEVLAGQELQLDERGHSERRALSSDATTWDWIDQVTPMMQIEGRSLREFLDWAARERGLTCDYPSADEAEAAREIRLNGSIEGMTIEEALLAVLPTCGMTHRIENGRLVVERPAGSPEAS